jgi:hypothetical protein
MSENEHKTPEKVSDEDYKVAPTSADKQVVNKERVREHQTGENYELPPSSATEKLGEAETESVINEELEEGVE